MYEWPSLGDTLFVAKQALIGMKTSLAGWRDPLGHIASIVLNFLVSQHNLVLVNSSLFALCYVIRVIDFPLVSLLFKVMAF